MKRPTMIGVPTPNTSEGRAFFALVEKLRKARGLAARSELLRQLVREDAERKGLA